MLVSRLEQMARSLVRMYGGLPPMLELEDLVQDGWLGITEADATWQPNLGGSLAGWRWRVSHYRMLDAIRRGRTVYLPHNARRVRGAGVGPVVRLDVPTCGLEIAAHPVDLDLRLDLERAVQVLTPRQELLVARYYIEGRSWEAVARELRYKSTQTAQQAACTALRRVGRVLAPELGAGRVGPAPAPHRGRRSPVAQSTAAFRVEIQQRHAERNRLWALFHPGAQV